jgi:hypothetical protein
VQEGRIDARAVRPPYALAVGHLAEVVVRADVLEGQVPARLDLKHLRRAQRLGEGAYQPLGVAHHLAERVHALHLRREQVVARSSRDAGVPRDPSSSNRPTASARTSGSREWPA